MNILYVHGFGSSYDSEGDKVQALGKLGKVFGVNIDYTHPESIYDIVRDAVHYHNIDLLVGTSMGGWTVSWMGSHLNLPFVAVNPCTHPSEMLRKYLGSFEDHTGASRVLTEQALGFYQDDFVLDGAGMVLLDEGDEIIDAEATRFYVSDNYPTVTYSGGDHRFQHMPQSISVIQMFLRHRSL